MNTFHFSLEAVLRVRMDEFERARQAFAECAQWRMRAAALVAETQGEIDACHQALSENRERRTTRTDQILFLNALQYQQDLLREHNDQLARVERDLEARRLAMVAAQRALDALDRLKDRKLRAHRAEAQRREEAMIDDLIAARFAMRSTEVAA